MTEDPRGRVIPCRAVEGGFMCTRPSAAAVVIDWDARPEHTGPAYLCRVHAIDALSGRATVDVDPR